jgi:hypothetical protein
LYGSGGDQSKLVPSAIICIVFWLFSLYPLFSYFGTSYAVAQASELSNNTDESVAGLGAITNLTSIEASASSSNETLFLDYNDSTYGIRIKYPSNWDVFPQTIGSNQNETISNSKDLQLIAQFSSPTRENVTISMARLVEEFESPVYVKQFINNLTRDSGNAFAAYRLLDLRINSEKASNLTLESPTSEFNASGGPVIYNLTYSGERIEGDDRSHVRGMDVGAIANKTAYNISFQSSVENYSTYLQDVLEMIYSFEISDNNNVTAPKFSSSQTTISAPPGFSSNRSEISREQNTVMGSETTNSSPSASSINPQPSIAGQQPSLNYYPSDPSSSPGPGYPTGQFYPPGYSPYPPPNYMGPYTGYSPYTGYYPYTDYSPNIVIDPVLPVTPVIPPIEYADPTILSYNTYNDTAGTFHVVGEVQNPSPYLVTSVQVIAAFYDNLNELLAVKFAYTNPPSIPSGQIAFFDLTIPPGTLPVDRVSQWTLRLIWQ